MPPKNKPTAEKTLILIRHADRDKPLSGTLDNGLNKKGRKQAGRLLKRFEASYYKKAKASPERPVLFSSPKARCIETIDPIARRLKMTLVINPLLDEEGNVLEKVRAFLEWWRLKGPALTVACSHGDWLPECIRQLSGQDHTPAKGAWAELRCALWDQP